MLVHCLCLSQQDCIQVLALQAAFITAFPGPRTQGPLPLWP